MDIIRPYYLHIDHTSSCTGIYHNFFNIKQLNGQSLHGIDVFKPYNMRAMQNPNPRYIYTYGATTPSCTLIVI